MPAMVSLSPPRTAVVSHRGQLRFVDVVAVSLPIPNPSLPQRGRCGQHNPEEGEEEFDGVDGARDIHPSHLEVHRALGLATYQS